MQFYIENDEPKNWGRSRFHISIKWKVKDDKKSHLISKSTYL